MGSLRVELAKHLDSELWARVRSFDSRVMCSFTTDTVESFGGPVSTFIPVANEEMFSLHVRWRDMGVDVCKHNMVDDASDVVTHYCYGSCQFPECLYDHVVGVIEGWNEP